MGVQAPANLGINDGKSYMSIAGFNGRVAGFFSHKSGLYLFGGFVTVIVAGAAYYVIASNNSEAGPRSSSPANEVEGAPAKQPTIVKLTPAQRAAGGIIVEAVSIKPYAEVFPAPGEVKANEYATSNVSPRLRATVISRQARLGDRVRNGQALVTLYSPEMAEAESTFVLASKNFARMSRLKDYVSGQQFDEAEVKRDEARGRLETYGLSAPEIAELASKGLASRPAGQFDLTAPQAGVITTDAFRLGEVLEPGKTLFEISNLSTVWIEAHVSPEIAPRIAPDRARVTAGGKSYDAKIIQTLVQLNETTRTVGIRLEVANTAGTLKPGQYVNVELSGQAMPELTVPTEAILRDADGNWLVYIENAEGAFAPIHVQPLYAAGDETAISGIPPGTRIVTKGAFFVNPKPRKPASAIETERSECSTELFARPLRGACWSFSDL